MILRKFNIAEAIIEPYYDGGESDMKYPETKLSMLPHYTQETDTPSLVRASQTWHSVNVDFDGCKPGGSFFEMKREFRLDVSDYDTLRLFGAMPKCMETTVSVKYDGAWHTLDTFPGNDTTSEHNMPLPCKVLEGVGYRFFLQENKPASATLHWLGLVNQPLLETYLRQKTGMYSPEWEDYLKPEDGAFEPQIGIWFDKDELETLRKKVYSPLLAPYYAQMKAEAEKHLSDEPEKNIGDFIGKPDRRYVLDRSMDNPDTSSLMQTMAFVGLIEKRADMMRMAARMALSAAHCTWWTEGPMGMLPGCPWHHRSFTEEVYARGCAIVLDWAGDFLTQYGRTCILDAIAMKALPRMESDYRRMEYIRHMNQGICFNWGRLAGLLAMESAYPRYDIRIEEAERELVEMIEEYVLSDGGTMEGPGYWAYTFSQALPQFYLLSRWHKKTFEEYASETLLKTGEHALSLLSIKNDGAEALPLNDAHGGYYTPALMAAYARLSPNPDYGRAISAAFAAGKVTTSLELLILVPDELPEEKTLCRRGFMSLPALGQTRITREDDALGAVDLFLMGGPAYFGHYHSDKGSFILETADETFACDRGVTGYSHPDTNLLQLPGYHNLLCPELPDGSICKQVADDNDGTGAKLVSADFSGGVFDALVDTTGAWPNGFITKNTRRITSSCAREYLIEDVMELFDTMAVSFRLNTRMPMEKIPTGVVVRGEKADLYVEPVDWTPENISIAPESVDGDLESVNLLRMFAAPAKAHHLKTKLTLKVK